MNFQGFWEMALAPLEARVTECEDINHHLCENPLCECWCHNDENWCGPCGAWISGEPCDET